MNIFFFLLPNFKSVFSINSFGTNHFGSELNQLTGFPVLMQEPGYLCCKLGHFRLVSASVHAACVQKYLGQHKGTSDILIIVFH